MKIKYEISSTILYCQSKIIKKIYTPVLTSSNLHTSLDKLADGHGTKQNTGFSENWKANNIYDFAGNCYEFTQEADSTYSRAYRGGYYDYYGSLRPASYRLHNAPTSTISDHGSRPTLYLIP